MRPGGFTAARSRRLDDGKRLHLSHGPIDLVIEASADEERRKAAYRAADRRFATILGELVEELDALRSPDPTAADRLQGAVARRMAGAVAPFRDCFITPMAAVAGAVADEVLAQMGAAVELAKAYVNNGGDIALHLGPGQAMRVAMLPEALAQRTGGAVVGLVRIEAGVGVGGIATSGAGGRSFSLGIAEAVTVLAADAATADAAATVIAGAVDVAHPAIERRPACDLEPDSDLGARAVTVHVPALPEALVAEALGRGRDLAEHFQADGRIAGAALFLQDQFRTVGRAEAAAERS